MNFQAALNDWGSLKSVLACAGVFRLPLAFVFARQPENKFTSFCETKPPNTLYNVGD